MQHKVFTHFRELAPLLKGNTVYVQVGGVLIRTGYSNIKASLDFENYSFGLSYLRMDRELVIKNIETLRKRKPVMEPAI